MSMLGLILVAQAAAPTAVATQLPDIEIRAHADIRSVKIRSQGLRSGAVLDLAKSGLSVVSSTVNAAGDTVRRVRGSDGLLYEVVTDTAGKILRSTRIAS